MMHIYDQIRENERQIHPPPPKKKKRNVALWFPVILSLHEQADTQPLKGQSLSICNTGMVHR